MTRLQAVIACVVTMAWLGTLVWRAINDHATDYAAADTAVLLVFGFLFSADAIKRRLP